MCSKPIISIVIVLQCFLFLPVLTAQDQVCERQLTFTLDHEGNREIYLWGQSDQQFINVTNSSKTNDYQPIWSPNGRQLVFVSEKENRTKLKLLDLETSKEVVLAEASHDIHQYHAIWSPNGQSIAFVTQNGELAVAEPDGFVHPVVNADFHLRQSIAWSPDSHEIVFASQVIDGTPAPGEIWHIYTVNVRTSQIEFLAPFEFLHDYTYPREPRWLYWLPDNQHIIVIRHYPGGPEYAVYSLNIESKSFELLENRIVAVNWPVLSPDGTALFYSTSYEVNKLNVYSGETINLALDYDEGVSGIELIPRSTIISFSKASTIYLVDIERNLTLRWSQLPILGSFVWRSLCP